MLNPKRPSIGTPTQELQVLPKGELAPAAGPGRMENPELPQLTESAPPSIHPGKSKGFYQPELDSLRFMAFMGVFLYHCVPIGPAFYKGWPHAMVSLVGAILTGGAFGVALFFALSAYLITNLLLREKEKRGALDTRSFYIRRILRIWPLYFAFLALAALLPLILRSQHLPFTFIAGYSLLAGNWVYVFLGDPRSVAVPLWSVSVEEQFYLAWPLVIRRASRASIAKVAVGLLIAANVSRLLLAFADAPSQVVAYNTISCVDPIALGILLALALREPLILSTMKRTALFLASVGVMIGSAGFLNYDERWGNVVGRSLAAFATVGILVSFLGWKSHWIRHPVLLYLGKISYGLYVIHLFGWLCAFHILRESSTLYQTLTGRLEIDVLGLAITIVGAAVSYRWLESPFLRLKERFAYVRSRPV